MTYEAVVHILLNSYTFLSLPEGQWLRIIKGRSPGEGVSLQLEFFPQGEEPNLRITKQKPMYRQLKKNKSQSPILLDSNS